jgi:hypothetical protein
MKWTLEHNTIVLHGQVKWHEWVTQYVRDQYAAEREREYVYIAQNILDHSHGTSHLHNISRTLQMNFIIIRPLV